MLQELDEELRNELSLSFSSKFKSYGQLDFEGNLIIVEYVQHLWFQVKLMAVQTFHIPKNSSLYSIKDSPNFSVFLNQIEAFKVTQDQYALDISFIIQLKFEQNLKKETFIIELQNLKNNKPHELKSIIQTSMNKYQKHYQQVINNMPFNDQILDVFQNDQASIFIQKGCLVIHNIEQLPHKKVEKKIYFNQSQNQEKIVVNEISDTIFSQLNKMNKKDQQIINSIVNSVQTYKYFTFYNHKFLLLYYTVFLKVLDDNQLNIRQDQIDDTIIQQSVLFAVTNEDQHKLINFEADLQQSYPQMVHLFGKQLSNIMDQQSFMKIFTDTIIHENINQYTDVLELNQKFKVGSVLLYRNKFFTNQACVYLGSDLVITVKFDSNNINKKDQNNSKIMSDEQVQMQNDEYMDEEEQKKTDDGNDQIFQFSRFDEFIKGQKRIEEIRFKFQPYNKQELFDKALQMNKLSYQFNIYKQNSEHLAFELASGFRFSPQQKLLVNKIGEVFQNLLFSK